MEAGPRDNEETTVDGAGGAAYTGGSSGRAVSGSPGDQAGRPVRSGRWSGGAGRGGGTWGDDRVLDDDRARVDGRNAESGADEPGSDAGNGAEETPEEPQELRPQRKLRLWQLAPIVGLGTLGSLMFAFPLAFEPGGGSGDVVSMLGLLLCGCAAGWGTMAARRVGATWPGLPARGSGRRADWRVVGLYSVAVCAVVALAILRVDRLQ